MGQGKGRGMRVYVGEMKNEEGGGGVMDEG